MNLPAIFTRRSILGSMSLLTTSALVPFSRGSIAAFGQEEKENLDSLLTILSIPVPHLQLAAGVISAAFTVYSFFTDDTDEKLDLILQKLDRIQTTLDRISADLEDIRRRLDDLFALVSQIPDKTVSLTLGNDLTGIANSIRQAAKEASLGGGGQPEAIKTRLAGYLDLFVQRRNSLLALYHGRYAEGATAVASLVAIEIGLTRLVMSFEHGDAFGTVIDAGGYQKSVAERLRVMAKDAYLPFLEECVEDGSKKPLTAMLASATEMRVAAEAALGVQNQQASLGCARYQSPMETIVDGKLTELAHPFTTVKALFADMPFGTLRVLNAEFSYICLLDIWYTESTEYLSEKENRKFAYRFEQNQQKFVLVNIAPKMNVSCKDVPWSIFGTEYTRRDEFISSYLKYISALEREIITTGLVRSVTAARDTMRNFV